MRPFADILRRSLTRGTLAEILIDSGRLPDVFKNPQEFLTRALFTIRKALDDSMVDGIKYERIDGREWEMLLFERERSIPTLIEVKPHGRIQS